MQPAPDDTPGDLPLIIVMGMGWWENSKSTGEKKLLQEVEEADQPGCGEFSARS